VDLSNFFGINKPYILKAFAVSATVSVVSAVVGAFAGALLAYAIVTGNPRGILRRILMSAAGVIAQFGGVTLAFAFVATLGTAGVV
jgi:putative spermidine/putrescine transport system permease protein